MPDEKKEPQSYGSQGGWAKGETGQKVNRPDEGGNRQQADFYASRTSGEETAPHRGGYASTEGAGESVAHYEGKNGSTGSDSIQRVPNTDAGAKRDGFFKKRDY